MRTGMPTNTAKYAAKLELKELRLALGLEPWQIGVMFRLGSTAIDDMESLDRKKYPTHSMLLHLKQLAGRA